MNPHLCAVVLRPRGPLEIFDLSLRLIRARWASMWRLAGLVLLPPALACAGLAWLTSGAWWLVGVPLLLAPWLQVPFVLLAGRALFDRDPSVRVVGRELMRAWLGIGGAVISQGLAMVLGCLVCGWGAVPALAGVLYLQETCLLERVDTSRGVRRSLRLAGAHPGVALTGAVAWLGLTLWGGAVGEVGGQSLFTFVLQLGEPFGAVMGGQVTPFLLIGMLLTQPLYAVYRLLLYVDVRTRVEGWDLQVGLRAAGMAS